MKAKISNYLLIVLVLLSMPVIVIGQNQSKVISDSVNGNNIPDSMQGQAVFIVCDKMPEFIGGDEARIRFLSGNIKYPELAINEPFQSTIYLSFIIDTAGNVANIGVLRPQFSDRLTELEKESMRVLSLMPKWIPGEQNGKKVPVRFIMPIKFDPGQ